MVNLHADSVVTGQEHHSPKLLCIGHHNKPLERYIFMGKHYGRGIQTAIKFFL